MRLGRLLPLFLLLSLALPASALGDDFQTILQDYRGDGRLDGCYKAYQLHNAGRAIPPDIDQYTPGFRDALAAAQGGCNRGGNGAPAPVEPAPPPSAGTAPETAAAPKVKTVNDPPKPNKVPRPVLADLPTPDLSPATVAGVTGSDPPGGLIVLLIAAGIALATALAWTIAWFMGWSPERFTRPLTAAFGNFFQRR